MGVGVCRGYKGVGCVCVCVCVFLRQSSAKVLSFLGGHIDVSFLY